MKARALRHTVSWLCLGIQVFGAALTSGRVLCVAADGHVALEAAHPGACVREAERHHGQGSPARALASCTEHPCADIALRPLAWRSSSERDAAASVFVPRVAVLLPPPTPAPALAAVLAYGRSTLATESQPLRARRGIVLRV